jgi:hypothetical protein
VGRLRGGDGWNAARSTGKVDPACRSPCRVVGTRAVDVQYGDEPGSGAVRLEVDGQCVCATALTVCTEGFLRLFGRGVARSTLLGYVRCSPAFGSVTDTS